MADPRKNLKSHFDSHIYHRGESYYRSGHVESLKAFTTKNEGQLALRGEVVGSDDYHVSFVFDLKNGQFNRFDCSCPYGANCKHEVALGLEFLESLTGFSSEHEKLSPGTELQTALMYWLNEQSLAAEYDESAEDFFDDYDEDDDEDEDEDEEDGNGLAESVKLLASALRKQGLDDARIQGIINNLAKELDVSRVSPTAAKSRYVPPRAAEAELAQSISDYRVVLRFRYAGRLDEPRIEYKNGMVVSAELLLKKCKDLSREQKELLAFLKQMNAYYFADYYRLFALLKASQMSIYWEEKNVRSELLIALHAEPPKLEASLDFEAMKNIYTGETENSIVFSLDRSRGNEKKKIFIFDAKHLITIHDSVVASRDLSERMMKLAKRTRDDGYRSNPADRNKAILDESEMIALPSILKECRKEFDFSTTLDPAFSVQKYDKAEACLEVDYDAKGDSLRMRAIVDYGLEVVDVAESVYHKRHHGRDQFSRFSARKYLIKASAQKVEYAPIKKKLEIGLYEDIYYKSKDYGFNKSLRCGVEGEKEVSKFLFKYWDNITASGYKLRFVRDNVGLLKGDFKADFQVDLNAENDWLYFDVDCYCGQDKLKLADLVKYAENKSGFIKLADGRLLEISNQDELERFVMMLESFRAREAGGFEGWLYHAPELENIFTNSPYYDAKVQESFKRFMKEAKSGRPVERKKLPAKYARILRDYQKEGIDWFYFLRKYRFAGILADDMGLGKTLQALVLLDIERVKGKPSIVVCPKTLLYNWQLEAEKFCPDLKTIVIDGTPNERAAAIEMATDYDLVITGYAMMQKDAGLYEEAKIRFNYCVLDEAQFIKNHTTKNARVIKQISADYRLALTGTPLENSVQEIWSIFDFLMPGFLGSYNAFVKKYEKPIMKASDAKALDDLRRKAECFMLRRTKSEVLKELPPKVEQTAHCQLEKAQNILYQEVLANVKAEIYETVEKKSFAKSQIHILAGLTKLRQVCNHPVLLLKDKDHRKYESAKLNMFLELVDEIVTNRRKVLVFSQFTTMLDILASELDHRGIAHNYLSGQTKNRQALVDDFNTNSDKPVFLISLKAGGTGLNLTAADNVIIFDPWWNPSVENQAIDRAHRIGQQKSVNVYKLITVGTIEEKIVKLQEKKKFLFDSLVGESKDLFKKLTWDDVKSLFE